MDRSMGRFDGWSRSRWPQEKFGFKGSRPYSIPR